VNGWATSKDIFPRHQGKIRPAVPTDGKSMTESQADLTLCPFSLNHYKAQFMGYGPSGYDGLLGKF